MSERKSTRARHSYVPFYMNDWAAATSGMPRIVWSVLFQVCQYNWDKVEPVPHSRLKIMVADLGPQGDEIVNVLVEAGSLEVDERGVFSPRAIREAEKALGIWTAKSRGGKGGGKSKAGDENDQNAKTLPKSDGTLIEESSKTHGADQDQEQEQEQDSSKDESLSSGKTLADVVEAWNAMASTCGLAKVLKVSTERQKRLSARVDEHGAEAIIDGITTIPDHPFLLGKGDRRWKAHFDWLLQPAACLKLLEGAYAEGRGRPSGWTED